MREVIEHVDGRVGWAQVVRVIPTTSPGRVRWLVLGTGLLFGAWTTTRAEAQLRARLLAGGWMGRA